MHHFMKATWIYSIHFRVDSGNYPKTSRRGSFSKEIEMPNSDKYLVTSKAAQGSNYIHFKLTNENPSSGCEGHKKHWVKTDPAPSRVGESYSKGANYGASSNPIFHQCEVNKLLLEMTLRKLLLLRQLIVYSGAPEKLINLPQNSLTPKPLAVCFYCGSAETFATLIYI